MYPGTALVQTNVPGAAPVQTNVPVPRYKEIRNVSGPAPVQINVPRAAVQTNAAKNIVPGPGANKTCTPGPVEKMHPAPVQIKNVNK
jgi:hypothetical protein